MVSYIRAEFDTILRTVDWMDDETRVRAINKSLAITPHIAYPDELLIESKLTELYEGVSLPKRRIQCLISQYAMYQFNNLIVLSHISYMATIINSSYKVGAIYEDIYLWFTGRKFDFLPYLSKFESLRV